MYSLNESILNSFKEAFLLEDYKSARIKLIEKGVSKDEADSLISRHKELKKLNRLDKSLIDIDILVKNFSPEKIKRKLFNISTQTKSEVKKRIEGKIVAENEEYLVYKIDTPEEAYRFHGLTKWCICSGTESEARTHFNHYLNGFKNTFYFFVRKNITDLNDEWNYIALQRSENESKDTYWSMTDKAYKLSDIPVNLPEFNKPPFELLTVEEGLILSGLKKNANGEFDIDGDFDLKNYKYLIVDGKLAVKFGKVSGDFGCYSSDLTSLEGCPKEVGGNFDCSRCEKLTSLEGCPKEVGGDFDCRECKNLTSLEGCPKEVGGDFGCRRCEKLTSLEGCPKTIGGWFSCSRCTNLTSLKGCPSEVDGTFDCSNCDNLKSLEGGPSEVGADFWCDYCVNLTSLEGCPERVGGSFNCYYCNNLKNLEGCPRKVNEYFECSGCKSLTSLKGCPEKVGGDFYCIECGIRFTEDEVRSLCDVSGKISC